MRICVIGTGYVGTVSAVCLTHVGHEVVGLEIDRAKLDQLRGGVLPFIESRCDELLRAGLETGRLSFTDDVGAAIESSQVIMICVGTPLTRHGNADVTALEQVVKDIAPYLRGELKVIVTKSTVPVGSGDWITMLVEDRLPRDVASRGNFAVVSNPEFLREGSAVQDFLHPDRIVIGSTSPQAIEIVAEMYEPLTSQRFDGGNETLAPVPLLKTSLESSEMIKYAANAFLATKISFINEIANICDRIGGDITEVAAGIGLDQRIGASFLSPGIGWGGSCFRKDILALENVAEEYGYTPLILKAAVTTNDYQRHSVIRILQDKLRILKGKRISLLGLSFKPFTDDLRDAPSLTLIDRLHSAGAGIKVFDPVVDDIGDQNELVTFAASADEALVDADAAVLVTEWPDLVDLDWKSAIETMRTPFVVDGRNALDDVLMRSLGFHYVGIGRG